MAVVQVVNHAHVADPVSLQPLDNRDLVFGLAEPAAVVIKRERTADLSGFLRQRLQLGDGGFHSALLFGALYFIGSEIEQHPELGFRAMTFEQVEDDPRFPVQFAGGDPEGVEGDSVPLEGGHLGVECGDVLTAPVIREMLEAQLLKHGRPIFGRALLAVERHDAPGDQVVSCIQPLRCLGHRLVRRSRSGSLADPRLGLGPNRRQWRARTNEKAQEQIHSRRRSLRGWVGLDHRHVILSIYQKVRCEKSLARGMSAVWLIAGWPRAGVSCRVYAAYGALDLPSIVCGG